MERSLKFEAQKREKEEVNNFKKKEKFLFSKFLSPVNSIRF
jgi:hypothetical protein